MMTHLYKNYYHKFDDLHRHDQIPYLLELIIWVQNKSIPIFNPLSEFFLQIELILVHHMIHFLLEFLLLFLARLHKNLSEHLEGLFSGHFVGILLLHDNIKCSESHTALFIFI